jgi:hypothetical protein
MGIANPKGIIMSPKLCDGAIYLKHRSPKKTPILNPTSKDKDVKLSEGFAMAQAQQLIPGGAHRANQDKLQWELLPVGPLEEITKVFQFGLKKYNRDNWRKGFPWTSVFGSTMRHLMAWASGEDRDEESGLLHLAHAAVNILFIIEYQLTNTGIDDRYKVTK